MTGNKKVRGFTLIELVIVIAIIGILAAILVPAMMNYIRNSRIAKFNANAKTVHSGAVTALAFRISDRDFAVSNGDIYTNGSSSGSPIASPQSGGDDIDLEPYLGNSFSGYFGFLLNHDGSGVIAAVWSDRPVAPASVRVMTIEEVTTSFKMSGMSPVGCFPIAY